MKSLLESGARLLVLTGAGVSAESGLPTFRDANGLWERHPVHQVASPQGFASDPRLVWRFYSQRREGASGCVPNPGHAALVEAERRLGDAFLLVTQNVDGLHLLAGSQRVVELHGNLFTSRCSTCARPPFEDRALYFDRLPECSECAKRGQQAYLRPHIVWFGEALATSAFSRIEKFFEDSLGERLLFLAAGTSGSVYPAADLVNHAKDAGAETYLVNAEPADNGSRFDHLVLGKSGELLPQLLA